MASIQRQHSRHVALMPYVKLFLLVQRLLTFYFLSSLWIFLLRFLEKKQKCGNGNIKIIFSSKTKSTATSNKYVTLQKKCKTTPESTQTPGDPVPPVARVRQLCRASLFRPAIMCSALTGALHASTTRDSADTQRTPFVFDDSTGLH